MPDMLSLRHIAIALATAAILFLVRAVLAHTPPRRATSEGGTIAPNKTMIWGMTLASLALAALPLALWYREYGWIWKHISFWQSGGGWALIVGAVFTAFAGVIATSLTRRFDVTWDGDGVTGPASYGIPPFGPRMATVRFDDIADLGTDWLGSWYVENARRDRVRWNYVYSGYPALMEAIVSRRPDLFDDDTPDGPAP